MWLGKEKPRDERGFDRPDRWRGTTWGIGKPRSCDLNVIASTLVHCATQRPSAGGIRLPRCPSAGPNQSGLTG